MANSPVTNIVDLANVPTEMEICGKKYKVQRLSMKEIIGTFENIVREEYDKETIKIAKSLETEDRRWFLTERSTNKPKGQSLYSQAIEFTETFNGLFTLLTMGLNKLQVVTESEISNIMMSSTKNEIIFSKLVSYLLGYDIDVAKDSPVVEDPSKKK